MFSVTEIWIGFGLWAVVFTAFSLHLVGERRLFINGRDNVQRPKTKENRNGSKSK